MSTKPLLIDLEAEMPTRANLKRELEIAWAAGFIDGEGYIGTVECTHKLKNYLRWFSAVVNAGQVKREPLAKLQQLFGGSVGPAKNGGYGAAWQWRLYGDNAVRALEQLLPYLVNKQRQAVLVIEFQTTKRKTWEKVAPEVHARREAIHYELRKLNATRRKDAERLSEEAPVRTQGDAIVRPATNNEVAEVDRKARPALAIVS